MRDPRSDAKTFHGVPGRSDVRVGQNGLGFVAVGQDGSTTPYHGSAHEALEAYDEGVIFGSNVAYEPGIGGSPVDAHLVSGHSGITGTRGARMRFGAEGELGDGYGRLYRSPPFHELERASSGDRGTLLGRSGSSGYRGGRPTFGSDGGEPPSVRGAHEAEFRLGPMEYKGSPWGAAALGVTSLILLFKGPFSS